MIDWRRVVIVSRLSLSLSRSVSRAEKHLFTAATFNCKCKWADCGECETISNTFFFFGKTTCQLLHLIPPLLQLLAALEYVSDALNNTQNIFKFTDAYFRCVIEHLITLLLVGPTREREWSLSEKKNSRVLFFWVQQQQQTRRTLIFHMCSSLCLSGCNAYRQLVACVLPQTQKCGRCGKKARKKVRKKSFSSFLLPPPARARISANCTENREKASPLSKKAKKKMYNVQLDREYGEKACMHSPLSLSLFHSQMHDIYNFFYTF